jgi:hypothetical protein
MTLTFIAKSGFQKTYSADDFYICFGILRSEFSDVIFLCKGAKLNVHPSRMSSQMSGGMVDYELELAKPCEEENEVRIFDCEDKISPTS